MRTIISLFLLFGFTAPGLMAAEIVHGAELGEPGFARISGLLPNEIVSDVSAGGSHEIDY
jgi:hypothetical protein